MRPELSEQLIQWADKYNSPQYFEQDPIAFPREFMRRGASLKDIEISAVFSAHFAWGRREIIVRDLERLFEQMEWKPFDYVQAGDWRKDETSIHRTIKWSEVAGICHRLREWYRWHDSLESLNPDEMRTCIFRQKSDPRAANKKIMLLRRWMVRNDGIVDLGLWKKSKASELIIPLDVHVHNTALALGLTKRSPKDYKTALEITHSFKEIWPEDPVKGDFALFGYGIDHA